MQLITQKQNSEQSTTFTMNYKPRKNLIRLGEKAMNSVDEFIKKSKKSSFFKKNTKVETELGANTFWLFRAKLAIQSFTKDSKNRFVKFLVRIFCKNQTIDVNKLKKASPKDVEKIVKKSVKDLEKRQNTVKNIDEFFIKAEKKLKKLWQRIFIPKEKKVKLKGKLDKINKNAA